MPAVSGSLVSKKAFRVLVTGFGPFANYDVNPSWLAVKPLHNTVINLGSPSIPVTLNDQVVLAEENDGSAMRQIHITTLMIPVTYEAVLSTVPGLHARPPVLPATDDMTWIEPPEDKYDFILHIGVAGRGPLRVEKIGHGLGYIMKDAKGELAPIGYTKRRKYGFDPEVPTRDFGGGCGDDLETVIDVEGVVRHLKDVGIEQVYTSVDAGHYLCDFIYYRSLAEARGPASTGNSSKVLFLHCPPVNQPLSTEHVTEAIRQIIAYVYCHS